MLGNGLLATVSNGSASLVATGGAGNALLSIGLAGGTASAQATFTATVPQATASGTATSSFVVQAPANGYSVRRFVCGIQLLGLTASVASNGTADVELL